MGCSNTKQLRLPRNPIEELQFRELQRERIELQRQKEQVQIKKLQKKLAKKQKKKKTKKSKHDSEERTYENEKADNNPTASSSTSEKNKQEEFNLQIENTIQKQLENDLCAFVLDQTTFTMEFFGNYENELTSILAEFLDKENKCTEKLEEHSILLANPLDAAVSKWVRFKPTHGSQKSQSQLLQPPVIYVIFENIDISRPNDANYDSITPLCRVNLETDSYRTTPCKEDYIDILREIKWKGYVRLRLRDDKKPQDSTEVYATGKCNQNNQSVYGSKTISTASSGYGSEGDYDYIYITLLNTHQPLAKLKMNKESEGTELDTKALPDSCATRLSKYIDVSILAENDDDDDDEETDDGASVDGKRNEKKSKAFRDYETMQAIRRFKLEQERRRKLLQQRYLNSKEFMCYFGELMRQKLAKHLPIGENDLETATYRSASIFTKDYEFIPAIHVAQNAQSWPECALQFRLRERPVNTHPQTGERVQWPTHAMMKQIETFGYHVIPLGYAPKKRRNPFRELEWRIVFPKAERYLERHLSHTQVKVFMMMKALIKTFIEPVEKDKALLFAMDHIRTHLFWECERDYTAWPEEFLGDVLVRFIESFMYRLRHKRLRDYFIEERNLFESIPEYSLMTVYTILADIAGNPLMHLMVAFRNLELSEKFFPKLNFKNIFYTLAYDNIVHLKQLSKNTHALTEKESDDSELDLSVDNGPVGLVGREKHRERTTGKLRRRTCQLKLEIEKTKQEQKSRRASVESIDVEFLFSNDLRSPFNERINQGVESLRRTNLLEMLLDHFEAMVRKSAKFGNIGLAQAWLRQAKRLTKFYNDFGCDMYAKDYENSISAIGRILDELKDSCEFSEEIIPTLPKRISESIQKRKINKIADNNAYEEVIPMDDTLPSIQSAMQIWENKLKKTENRQQSGESSPESKKLSNLSKVVVEVHSQELNYKESERNAEVTTGDIILYRKSSDRARKFKEHSQVDMFRETREAKQKHEKDIKLDNEILNVISKEIDSPASKKSIKFQKPTVGKTKMNSVKQKENGYVNEAYDDSNSDEFQTDTEGGSSMYSATEYSETEKSYQETTFIKNLPQKSQQSMKEEKVVAQTEKIHSRNKTKKYSSSDSDDDKKETQYQKTKSDKKLQLQNSGTEIIQIDSESSESSSEEDTPRFSFKCLENISIKAILESKELDEEDKLFPDECRNVLNINYDVPRADSDDRLLDLIALDNENESDMAVVKRSSKTKRRTKNKRRQRRKRNSRKSNGRDLQSVEHPDINDCVIQIETNEPKDIANGESSMQKSIFSKYINTETILKRFPVVSPEMIETVTESKQKIIAAIKNREKIIEVRDTLKAKTLQLKGALLQSSET